MLGPTETVSCFVEGKTGFLKKALGILYHTGLIIVSATERSLLVAGV